MTATYFKVSPGIICCHQIKRFVANDQKQAATARVDDGQLEELAPFRKVAKLL